MLKQRIKTELSLTSRAYMDCVSQVAVSSSEVLWATAHGNVGAGRILGASGACLDEEAAR